LGVFVSLPEKSPFNLRFPARIPGQPAFPADRPANEDAKPSEVESFDDGYTELSGDPSAESLEALADLMTSSERPPARAAIQKALRVISGLLVLILVAWVAFAWRRSFKSVSFQEATARAQRAVKIATAKDTFTQLQAEWKADGSWEQQISSIDDASYSLEVERVLARGSPIILVGEIDDVQSVEGQSLRLVTLSTNSGRSLGGLSFSLFATPDVAASIITQRGEHLGGLTKTFVSVATIQRVDKAEQAVNTSSNDGDLFVAHGTLHESRAIDVLALDQQDLGIK
jgi:hypothetical protein